MTAPLRCPPLGVCTTVVPARNEYGEIRERDGDTVLVQTPNLDLEWALRLADTWCPELHRGTLEEREIGRKAKEFTRDVLEKSDEGDLRAFIPLSGNHHENLNILKFLSFDRIPAYLFVGPTQTLNRMLVDARLASTTKGGQLGK